LPHTVGRLPAARLERITRDGEIDGDERRTGVEPDERPEPAGQLRDELRSWMRIEAARCAQSRSRERGRYGGRQLEVEPVVGAGLGHVCVVELEQRLLLGRDGHRRGTREHERPQRVDLVFGKWRDGVERAHDFAGRLQRRIGGVV